MTTKASWVNNEDADKIVSAVQESIKSGKADLTALKRMMDLIICVHNYDISNIRNQGVIGGILSKENLYGNKLSFTHYGHDINDMISIFWEEVFKKLGDAQTTGLEVEVRKIDENTEDQVVSKNGTNYIIRKTSCNPIHWLRNRGVMAVRNAITRAYNNHLYATCRSCGNIQSIVSTAERDDCKVCPKCKSTDTMAIFPDGHSSYRSKKQRACNTCCHTWDRKFDYKCYRCGSDNIATESSYSNDNTAMAYLESGTQSVDSKLDDLRFEADIAKLLKDMYRSLPTDPKDPTTFTKTHEIFNILVYPEASKEMCKQCVMKASRICKEACADSKLGKQCGHDTIINPAESCGSEFFTDECVNYSKKIGQYHGCSASLTSRRVKKVREYIKMYIVAHKSDYVCKELYRLLKKRGLL